MTENIDVTELFSRDPLSLTDEDIDNIIKVMREKRVTFKAGPATSAAAPKKTAKETAVSNLKIELDL